MSRSGEPLPDIVLGDDVDHYRAPILESDGAGGALLAYQVRSSATGHWYRFALIRGGEADETRDLRSGAYPAPAFHRVSSGWYVTARTHRVLDVLYVGDDGAYREIASLENSWDATIGEGHGGAALVYMKGRKPHFLRLAPEGNGRPVELGDLGTYPGDMRPSWVVPTERGWWVALWVSWRHDHHAAAPPEWRFIHTSIDGDPRGRAHVRFAGRGWPVDVLRAEDDALVGRLVTGRDEDSRQWRTFTVSSRAPCAPRRARAACEAETIVSSEPPLRHLDWEEHAEPDGRVRVSLRRRETSGGVRWRYQLDSRVHWLSAPAVRDGRVYFVTADKRRHQRTPRMTELRSFVVDEDDGSLLATSHLSSSRVNRVCMTATGGRTLVGLAGRRFALYELAEDGAFTLVADLDQETAECALGVVGGRIVAALAHVEMQTSTLPATSLHLHVLESDGTPVTVHSPPDASGYRVKILASDEGAALVWTDYSRWEYSALRLDSHGVPMGAPLAFATLYFGPRFQLENGPEGPVLHWWTRYERGIIPLCLAEERGETESAVWR